ncbi:hypothetical protein NDU88_004962 [Pleurodeles waltl]|uniref:Uncharacterized protein n=1 Tax=Pleurodeles waltl TaxID=8319 RepID=A0AAV7T9Z8_PLEWA|nr:hypothetical protein NDU88_004962 [Pleurodeles waltl]
MNAGPVPLVPWPLNAPLELLEDSCECGAEPLSGAAGVWGLGAAGGAHGHVCGGLGCRSAQRSAQELNSASGVSPDVLRCFFFSFRGLQVGVSSGRCAVLRLQGATSPGRLPASEQDRCNAAQTRLCASLRQPRRTMRPSRVRPPTTVSAGGDPFCYYFFFPKLDVGKSFFFFSSAVSRGDLCSLVAKM